ncbi:MAG TPA: hypothetical protein DCM73_02540 [Clostridiales bacterium]|nr:hypothetical protein [Clostridiales bacterium]
MSCDLPNKRRFHPDLIGSINEDDCKRYLHKLVIDRVFNGYMKEHGNI